MYSILMRLQAAKKPALESGITNRSASTEGNEVRRGRVYLVVSLVVSADRNLK